METKSRIMSHGIQTSDLPWALPVLDHELWIQDDITQNSLHPNKHLLFHHSHFLNLPFTLSISLSSRSHSPTRSQSPSQSHCTLIARFLKARKYVERVGAGAPVYLSVVLEYLVAEVTKHFGFFWCFVGWEFLILGVWVFGYLGMVLIGGMKLGFFF